MAYVYRYIDLSDGIIKYVGITCRDSNTAVMDRAQEHFYQDEWFRSKDWRIEYIHCLNKTEANCLESHFISKYGTKKYFNKAKTNHGLCSFLPKFIEDSWTFEDLFYASQLPMLLCSDSVMNKKIETVEEPELITTKEVSVQESELITTKEVCRILNMDVVVLRLMIIDGRFEWAKAEKKGRNNTYIIYKDAFYNSDEYFKAKANGGLF